MISHPRYDAIHEKNRFHKRAAHTYAQSSPKAQVYRTGVPHLPLNMYPFLNFLYTFEFRNYKGRHRFYVSKLNCCKRTMNVRLQTDKYSLPLGVYVSQVGNLCYRTYSLCFIMHDLVMKTLFINN